MRDENGVQDILDKLSDRSRRLVNRLLRFYRKIKEKRTRLLEFVRAYFIEKALNRAEALFNAFTSEDQVLILRISGKHYVTYNFRTV